jgi:hypothetical protein
VSGDWETYYYEKNRETVAENERLRAELAEWTNWEPHEIDEAHSLYQRLQRAGETRDFPAVVLCALRLLTARTEEPKP